MRYEELFYIISRENPDMVYQDIEETIEEMKLDEDMINILDTLTPIDYPHADEMIH